MKAAIAKSSNVTESPSPARFLQTKLIDTPRAPSTLGQREDLALPNITDVKPLIRLRYAYRRPKNLVEQKYSS